MAYLLLLSTWYFIVCVRASDPALAMAGHVYSQMSYNSTDSPLAQLVIKNKFVCAAQCAYQFPTCNTAVFNRNIVPQCWLYSQPLVRPNLIGSLNAVVYDFQENKFKATTSTSSTSTITTTVSSTSSTAVSTTTTVTFPYSGIQFNLDPSSLPGSWSLCYIAPYPANLNPTIIGTILSSCYRSKLLLGCRPNANSALTVAATGSRADVLYDCGSTPNCTHVANGVGWYFSDSYSWGFADGANSVLRTPCDNSSVNAGSRMCWNTQGGGDGDRCGSTVDPDTNGSWRKVIYHSN